MGPGLLTHVNSPSRGLGLCHREIGINSSVRKKKGGKEGREGGDRKWVQQEHPTFTRGTESKRATLKGTEEENGGGQTDSE